MKIKQLIYKWVKDNYGESEAQDPSWDIRSLAKYIEKNINKSDKGKEKDFFYKDYTFEVYNKSGKDLYYTDTLTIFYDNYEKGYIWQDQDMDQGDPFKTVKECLQDGIEHREEFLKGKLKLIEED